MAANHGGTRPGAGRKRRPIDPDVARIGRHDLAARLHAMPSNPLGRRRRCALTMASYDVPEAEIAAALAISEDDLRSGFGEELACGAALRQVSVLAGVWAQAREGKWPAISFLLKRLDEADPIATSRPRRRRRAA